MAGKPTLGEDAAWGPDHGPHVMLTVDIVGLTYVNQDEGVLASHQLIAQLYEKLTCSGLASRIPHEVSARTGASVRGTCPRWA